jgi:hypothetical protein
MSFPSRNEVAIEDFVKDLEGIIRMAPYHSFGRLLSVFQDRTAKDIYFMNDREFIEGLKKFINKEIQNDK